MAMPEERISGLEGKADDHARGIAELQGLIGGLDGKVDRRMEAIDRRFDAIDRRFDALSSRIDTVDQKLDRRFDSLEHTFSRQFNMLLLFQLTTLSAIVLGILTR